MDTQKFRQNPATVLVAIVVALMVPVSAHGEEYCKWTDENGVVHYAEKCPGGVKSETIPTEGERTESQIRAAEQHTRSLLSKQPADTRKAGPTQRYRSLPKSRLGPLPPNTVSGFLKTNGANYSLNSRTLRGNFVLFLEARENMPEGAWVEAAFPDPSDIENYHFVGKQVGPNQKFMLESPPTRDLKCWNYRVDVGIFSDQSKKELIGTHHQVIQSHVNLSLVGDTDDLLQGVTEGLCIGKDRKDFSRMSAEELEAVCQEEREKRLAPRREQLIQRCMESRKRSREHCENYHADYGDAQRTGPGTVRPPLYMDLPECVAARQARSEQQ